MVDEDGVGSRGAYTGGNDLSGPGSRLRSDVAMVLDDDSMMNEG